jgi:prevent-host-death family protein
VQFTIFSVMDQRIPAAEAHRNFSRLLRDVQGGNSFVITAYGKAVARIVPCDEAHPARGAARERLMARLAAQQATDIGDWRRDELHDRS